MTAAELFEERAKEVYAGLEALVARGDDVGERR